MHFPYGNNIKLYIEGGSHDDKIEMILKGFPEGVKIDFNALDDMLKRRNPSYFSFATSRREADKPVFTEGIKDGITTGGTIKAYIENKNIKSSDYSEVNFIPRPSHADFAAVKKYGSSVDLRGGGHFSGRLTALLCTAGSLAKDFLKTKNIEITAHIKSIYNIKDDEFIKTSPRKVNRDFPVINESKGREMIALIEKTKAEKDSVGGIIECAVMNLPAGLGEHMFRSAEERISAAMFAVPGVKGVDFGSGFGCAELKGSENNDPFYMENGEVKTRKNNSGGIIGGMTDGMPLIFSAAIKPTPSIGLPQNSVDLRTGKETELIIKGRHDPCIVPRAVPVTEAAAALAVLDLMLDIEKSSDIEGLRKDIEKTDLSILELLKKRLDIAEKIGEYKRKNGLPVENKDREKALIEKLTASCDIESDYIKELYGKIFEISKKHQEKNLEFGLIGKKLSHSYSPGIHSYLASYKYKLYELTENELPGFMNNPPDGFNVTIPYKKSVIPYLSYISPEARRIGSVNTVIKKPEGLFGFNTDYDGFSYLLKKSGIEVRNKKVLVLGSGGASLTVKAVLEAEYAKEITVISRSGQNNYENIINHRDADVIINTTPVGMYPDTGVSPVDLSIFSSLECVIDLIYNPSRTKLLYEAEKRHIKNMNGLPMLIRQAEKACEIFTGKKADSKNTERIIKEIENKTLNIILIGMPGCGKTTAGKKLSEITGREFIDTDKIIEEKTGMKIPDIFSKKGEDYFRKLETEVLKTVCREQGKIIATGGGAVTREENHYYIKENSEVIFLDRDIHALITSGRPLSLSKGLTEIYNERYVLYKMLSDRTINGDLPVDEIAGEILK